MAKLFLLRHFKSQWNENNRFAGWVDNPLSKSAVLEAKNVAEKLIIPPGPLDHFPSLNFSVIYTSPLIRNMETILRMFDNFTRKYPIFLHLDGGKMQNWGQFEGENDYIPVFVSESLNERYYGRLQGLNKNEVKKRYGEEMVHLWRRGFKERPPGGESLKSVFKRAVPFYKKHVESDLKAEKNVLLVASHNSLRALIKHIEGIKDEEIVDVELNFGALLEYEFDYLDNELGLRSKKYFAVE